MKVIDLSRRLWAEHTTYTRLVVGAIIAGSADTGALIDRLMKNQVDIANMFKGYDNMVVKKVESLLKVHIATAGTIVRKLVAKADATDDIVAWRQNGEDIADQLYALARIFTRGVEINFKTQGTILDESAWRAHMKDHLDNTIAEVNALISGDADAAIAAFDRVQAQAQHMAEAIANIL